MLKILQTLSLGIIASCLHGNDDKPFISGRNVFMKKMIINSPTHGVKEVLIDDEDFEYLNQFTWCAHKHRNTHYARRIDYSSGIGVSLRMHRVVLGVSDKSITVDHRDNNGLNNQKNNLRVATNSQNQANRPKRKHSVALYKGITPSQSKKGGWRAQIKKEGKVIALGYFDTQEQAAIAYDKAAKELHGEFANLNFKE